MSRQLPIVGARLEHSISTEARDLEALITAALERSDEPYPKNTQRAYRQAWARWQRWCDRRGIVEYVPVRPRELLGMLEEMERAGRARSTVELTLSAISAIDAYWRTTPDVQPIPLRSHPKIRRWMKTHREALAERPLREAPALLLPDLLHLVHELERDVARNGVKPDELAWLRARDHALIVVGWFAAFRVDSIARLRVSDVTVDDHGLELRMRKSKTDQVGEGAVKYLYAQRNEQLCPRTAWLRWRELVGDVDGEAFAFPTRRGARMTPDACAEVVTRRARAVGLRATGHSLRAGLATWAKLCGKPESDIQKHGGWASAHVMQRYFRRANARKQNPTEGLV